MLCEIGFSAPTSEQQRLVPAGGRAGLAGLSSVRKSDDVAARCSDTRASVYTAEDVLYACYR